MRELVEVELSGGGRMWAIVEPSVAARDAGLGARVTEILGLSEILEWVGDTVVTGLRRVKPDRVSVEFGVELAVGQSGLVAALGGAGGKAAIKVTMGWGDETGVPAGAALPAPEQQ